MNDFVWFFISLVFVLVHALMAATRGCNHYTRPLTDVNKKCALVVGADWDDVQRWNLDVKIFDCRISRTFLLPVRG